MSNRLLRKVLPISFFLIFLFLSKGAQSAASQITAEQVKIRDYKAVKVAITTSHRDAREVVRMLEEELTSKGFLITEQGDVILTGRVVVDFYRTRKTNPYQQGEFILHEARLALEDLKCSIPGRTSVMAYESLLGQGSHEWKGIAFKDAAKQIVKELKNKGFFHEIAGLSERRDRDILIDLSEIETGKRENEVISFIKDYFQPFIKKLLRDERKMIEDNIKDFVHGALKSKEGSISLNQRKLNDIFKGVQLQIRHERIRHRVMKPEKYKEEFWKYTGIGIIIGKKLCPLRNIPREIYDKNNLLVYGGEDARLKSILYFHSEEEIRRSPFHKEGHKLLKVHALGLTEEGNIIVANNDADRIILANEKGMKRGSIFREGKIFIISEELR